MKVVAIIIVLSLIIAFVFVIAYHKEDVYIDDDDEVSDGPYWD